MPNRKPYHICGRFFIIKENTYTDMKSLTQCIMEQLYNIHKVSVLRCYRKNILRCISKAAKDAKADPELGDADEICIGTNVNMEMDVIDNQYARTDKEFKSLAKEIFDLYSKDNTLEILSVAYYDNGEYVDSDNNNGFTISNGKIRFN